MPLDLSQPKVLVIGGGLSGLSAAHTLHERGANVLLLDKVSFIRFSIPLHFTCHTHSSSLSQQGKLHGRKLDKSELFPLFHSLGHSAMRGGAAPHISYFPFSHAEDR